MISLRECWRRCWPYRYFADLQPIDRATALVALLLSMAIAISFAALVRNAEVPLGLPSNMTAPPSAVAFA